MHPNDPKGVDLKKIRPLSTEERARVQTFPEDFVWLGGKTDREQMIGNAVPVSLARFVAKSLLDYVNREALPSSELLDVFDPDEILLPVRPLTKFGNQFTSFTAPIKAAKKRRNKSA